MVAQNATNTFCFTSSTVSNTSLLTRRGQKRVVPQRQRSKLQKMRRAALLRRPQRLNETSIRVVSSLNRSVDCGTSIFWSWTLTVCTQVSSRSTISILLQSTRPMMRCVSSKFRLILLSNGCIECRRQDTCHSVGRCPSGRLTTAYCHPRQPSQASQKSDEGQECYAITTYPGKCNNFISLAYIYIYA